MVVGHWRVRRFSLGLGYCTWSVQSCAALCRAGGHLKLEKYADLRKRIESCNLLNFGQEGFAKRCQRTNLTTSPDCMTSINSCLDSNLIGKRDMSQPLVA